MRGPWLYAGGALLVAAAVFLTYLLYLAARAVLSLMRARRCRHFAELGARKQRGGDVPGSVALLLKAESAWSLNSWDGSRESWLKDLDRLGSIGSNLVRSLAREPGTKYADFTAPLREMSEVLRERNNFGIDGRRMSPDVVIRWKASVQRLSTLRSRLRQVCESHQVARR